MTGDLEKSRDKASRISLELSTVVATKELVAIILLLPFCEGEGCVTHRLLWTAKPPRLVFVLASTLESWGQYYDTSNSLRLLTRVGSSRGLCIGVGNPHSVAYLQRSVKALSLFPPSGRDLR